WFESRAHLCACLPSVDLHNKAGVNSISIARADILPGLDTLARFNGALGQYVAARPDAPSRLELSSTLTPCARLDPLAHADAGTTIDSPSDMETLATADIMSCQQILANVCTTTERQEAAAGQLPLRMQIALAVQVLFDIYAPAGPYIATCI